ncbi:MAG: DUF6378 domain-containing protein [Hyphomicrobiales bacterium]
MKNIELFDEYAARLFAELYKSFPTKTNLNACKLCGHSEIDEYGRILDERGEPSKAFDVARSTIEWLYEAGYIRGNGMGAMGLGQAVLSPMGLMVLKSVPASLKIEESVGDRLSKLVKEGTYEAAREAVNRHWLPGARWWEGRWVSRMTEAAHILQATRTVIAERGATYGDAAALFAQVARRWSATLGAEVTASQAILCMLDLKLARLAHDPAHKDSMVDVAGYAALLADLAVIEEHGT